MLTCDPGLQMLQASPQGAIDAILDHIVTTDILRRGPDTGLNQDKDD
jgi:hypothetical protein